MKQNKRIKKILVLGFFHDPFDLLGQGTKTKKKKRNIKYSRRIDNLDLL